MWLVVDTNVLVDASGQGRGDFAADSLDMLKLLRDTAGFVLAIDRKQKILREYSNRICAPMFAYHWLQQLGRESRITPVTESRIPRGAFVELKEAHFDPKDHKLVEAALYSHRLIVTRDTNSFTPDVQTILRRKMSISVVSAVQLLQGLRANQLAAAQAGANLPLS